MIQFTNSARSGGDGHHTSQKCHSLRKTRYLPLEQIRQTHLCAKIRNAVVFVAEAQCIRLGKLGHLQNPFAALWVLELRSRAKGPHSVNNAPWTKPPSATAKSARQMSLCFAASIWLYAVYSSGCINPFKRVRGLCCRCARDISETAGWLCFAALIVAVVVTFLAFFCVFESRNIGERTPGYLDHTRLLLRVREQLHHMNIEPIEYPTERDRIVLDDGQEDSKHSEDNIRAGALRGR